MAKSKLRQVVKNQLLIAHLLWLRVSRFMMDFLLDPIRRGDDGFHKIVIIGDDFAEGVCDDNLIGQRSGVTAYLYSEMRASSRVRHQWQVLNRGHCGSNSYHWKPTCDELPKFSWFLSKPMWTEVFGSASFTDVEIVIIITGSNDFDLDPTSPDITVHNISESVGALRDLGKYVIVCGVPLAPNGDEERLAYHKQQESLLVKWVTETAVVDNMVIRGPDTSSIRYTSEELLGFDGVHLNSEGYTRYAKDLWYHISHLVTKIEFSKDIRRI